MTAPLLSKISTGEGFEFRLLYVGRIGRDLSGLSQEPCAPLRNCAEPGVPVSTVGSFLYSTAVHNEARTPDPLGC